MPVKGHVSGNRSIRYWKDAESSVCQEALPFLLALSSYPTLPQLHRPLSPPAVTVPALRQLIRLWSSSWAGTTHQCGTARLVRLLQLSMQVSWGHQKTLPQAGSLHESQVRLPGCRQPALGLRQLGPHYPGNMWLRISKGTDQRESLVVIICKNSHCKNIHNIMKSQLCILFLEASDN